MIRYGYKFTVSLVRRAIFFIQTVKYKPHPTLVLAAYVFIGIAIRFLCHRQRREIVLEFIFPRDVEVYIPRVVGFKRRIVVLKFAFEFLQNLRRGAFIIKQQYRLHFISINCFVTVDRFDLAFAAVCATSCRAKQNSNQHQRQHYHNHRLPLFRRCSFIHYNSLHLYNIYQTYCKHAKK